MGRQARAVHISRSVSTSASVALVPALTAQPRPTPRPRLSAGALRTDPLQQPGWVHRHPDCLLPCDAYCFQARMLLHEVSASAAAMVHWIWVAGRVFQFSVVLKNLLESLLPLRGHAATTVAFRSVDADDDQACGVLSSA